MIQAHFPSFLLSLTAEDVRHNNKLLKPYSLYGKRYTYRSLKSSCFGSDVIKQLERDIDRFAQNSSKHFMEAFNSLDQKEKYLLAKTLFIPADRYETVCTEIAESVLMFDEDHVKKEVIRAILHLLGKVPARCLNKDSEDDSPSTFLRLVEVLQKHGVESLAA